MTDNPARTIDPAILERLRELEARNAALEKLVAQGGEFPAQASLGWAGRANAWLAAIIESSDDAIVSKDLNGIVTSWNPGAERIFGFTAAEMIGSSITRIIPEDLLGEEDTILTQIRAGRKIDHFETIRRRKDGRTVHVSVTVSPVRDASGQVVGASKVARDVSSLKEAERARGILAAIVESSDDAIVSKDLTGIVTSWNRAAEQLFGYRAEEMIGTPLMRIVPPDLRHEEQLILAKVRAGERIEHFETARIARDGRRVEVSITISPVRNSQGTIIGASKVARDLTPQRVSERAQATLAAIVTGSDDAIISKTLEGIVTSWNPAAERLYGYGAQEMVGESILRIVPPDRHPEEDFILGKVRKGERLEHYETVRVRKDGARIDVAITVSPVRDSLGRLIGASKIARDMTRHKHDQRMKDQFLAVLAHELRNPLAPVRNALALLGGATVSDDMRRRLQEMASRQIGHMAALLDDLLDVSRLTTGRVELKRECVELGPLVAQAVEATRPTSDDHRHTIHVSEAAEPLWLDADPVRVTQIVVNLLTNACKYTDPEGRIDLRLRREADEAVIEVTDNGIGFSRETKARLFTLFAQADESLSRGGGGLGIGLWLVREFVHRHGGTVQAESEGIGKGSRFTVRLPTCEPPQETAQA